MITFKQFLQEEATLLADIISNLLKKGEKVAAYAEPWNKDPKKRKPKLYPVTKVVDNRVYIQVGQEVYTWFQLEGDEHDDSMHFKQEGDTWVLAEKGRKPIIS